MKTIAELQRKFEILKQDLDKLEKTPITYPKSADSEYIRGLVKVNKAREELGLAKQKELVNKFLLEGVLEFENGKKSYFSPKSNLGYNYVRRIEILKKSKSGKTVDIRIEMLDKNEEFSFAVVENVRISNLEWLIVCNHDKLSV